LEDDSFGACRAKGTGIGWSSGTYLIPRQRDTAVKGNHGEGKKTYSVKKGKFWPKYQPKKRSKGKKGENEKNKPISESTRAGNGNPGGGHRRGPVGGGGGGWGGGGGFGGFGGWVGCGWGIGKF